MTRKQSQSVKFGEARRARRRKRESKRRLDELAQGVEVVFWLCTDPQCEPGATIHHLPPRSGKALGPETTEGPPASHPEALHESPPVAPGKDPLWSQG